MFKLVIVEDEDTIRHSLECFIPWEKIGFQVVSTFSDGSDALEYLKEHPCDAVLTDILMSRMSGLEMIRSLHEICPEIKVVILSGHSDFGYAQQAIQYKVVYYLVKPVDEEELISVFMGIKEQLDFEKEEQSLAELETRDLKQLLQKTFFRDLLSGQVATENELSVYTQLLGMQNIDGSHPLIAFEINHHQEESPHQELGELALKEALKESLSLLSEQYQSFVIEEKADKWHVIFVGLHQSENDTCREDCNQKLQAFVATLPELAGRAFTCHLTHRVMRISELLINARNSEDSHIPVQKYGMDEALYSAIVSDYKLLVLELDLGCQDIVLHILDQIVFDLKDATLEDVRFVLKNLYSAIELNYKKRKIDTWDITAGKFDVNLLYGAANMEAITACFKEAFCTLCESLKNRKIEIEHSVIGHVLQYLDEHVNEDIGHDALAAKYRLHPGYLSRLFKQEMGETLSEYLLRQKIERAAKLLREGQYKIGEIATIVGYSASSYFSIMFKKYTGYSPREYSQRISL